jgi:hypothetical protein
MNPNHRFTLKHYKSGEIVKMTLNEILNEINRDRSDQWLSHNEADWLEGLEHFTEWRLVSVH